MPLQNQPGLALRDKTVPLLPSLCQPKLLLLLVRALFGPYDACEFITPEAYSARGDRWDQLVSLALPAPSEIAASSRASITMTACRRTFMRLGRSTIRTARVYYFGREAVEIREREVNVPH
ncbi:uncharacterized protein Z519_04453 [Cladophialophora bantiana CBS 173.52]|uniref:Uncharacterized protein n=1 Tax=Cladophialophora bantiana (strain ATCC 10958 / CBS 173.52 / CDC B-1940 / NIH 8579) TaxID=1442370 RepID=A0A0D2G784_CLAB1|nr:uncharacterized protein Z519_04453 [Cladophialophora bantiana CBS 173.52]KIW94477.1 hypothetical protein Z519_04453 [Cladophialophora bantiana CBS 173.52]